LREPMPKPYAAPGTLQFGKYAGTPLADVPADYLAWLIDRNQRDMDIYEKELQRREAVEEAELPMVARLVREGYTSLAKKLHPDHGGTADEFRALQAAYEQLKVVLKEIADV